MSEQQDKKPAQSKTVTVCVLIFVVLGVVAFNAIAPQLFPPPPGGGFQVERVMWAAVVGGVSAVIGLGVGKLIEAATKKDSGKGEGPTKGG